MGRRRKSKPTTLAVVIQDRSPSMRHRTEATISGFNEWLEGIQDDSDGDYLVTLTQFDMKLNKVYTSTPIDHIPYLNESTYTTNGSNGTALYDAVCETIKSVSAASESVDHVMVVIMTDGEENMSRKHTRQETLNLINRKRKQGWEFVFMGAGEESWAGGELLGFSQEDSIFYGKMGQTHRNAYGSLLQATTGLKEGLTTASNVGYKETKLSVEQEDGGKLAKKIVQRTVEPTEKV